MGMGVEDDKLALFSFYVHRVRHTDIRHIELMRFVSSSMLLDVAIALLPLHSQMNNFFRLLPCSHINLPSQLPFRHVGFVAASRQ